MKRIIATNRGATLIEMIIVVILLGVLSAMAFPMLDNLLREDSGKTFVRKATEESAVRNEIRTVEGFLKNDLRYAIDIEFFLPLALESQDLSAAPSSPSSPTPFALDRSATLTEPYRKLIITDARLDEIHYEILPAGFLARSVYTGVEEEVLAQQLEFSTIDDVLFSRENLNLTGVSLLTGARTPSPGEKPLSHNFQVARWRWNIAQPAPGGGDGGAGGGGGAGGSSLTWAMVREKKVFLFSETITVNGNAKVAQKGTGTIFYRGDQLNDKKNKMNLSLRLNEPGLTMPQLPAGSWPTSTSPITKDATLYKFNGDTTLTNNGNPVQNVVIIMESGDLRLTGNQLISGIIFAPDSTVEIRGTGGFQGVIIAREIIIGANSTVTFDDRYFQSDSYLGFTF